MEKKQYITPQIEAVQLNVTTMLALSGGEQTDMGVFPGSEKDAGNALANPFRDWGF